MKKNIFLLPLLFFVLFASCSFTNKKFENPNKDKLLLETFLYIVANGHYQPMELNDEYSKKVFKEYLNQLDGQKRYFLQSDYNEFKKYETQLDDDLKKLDISFFNLTYERLLQRMQEAEAINKSTFKKSFDFSKKESIDVDYENLSYAKDKSTLKERWRKIAKFSTLANYETKLKEEQNKKEKDPNYKIKSDSELKKEAEELTQKTFDEIFTSYRDLLRDDWFSIYLNTFAEVLDPHSGYMAPDLKERFDRDMSGKFEGIGAQLQKKTEGIRISDIIMGGPVWKGKLLEVGDLILKVGESDKAPVDVVGMRLDDAVKLIKGPKGTEVRLTVKRVDGTIEVVPIVRDIVEIEETYAKSALIKEANHTYGIINLPKFYIDFQNYKERNAASDMALEIANLKKSNVDGIILDLRNNGGGSLKTVVDIAGLFIKEGPIVQVRAANGSVEVLKDNDKNIQWDKPLVILVNELSASASEILAAAMQDYQRAIVIGSKQTFGKGTVQTMLDLNKYVRNNSFDLGALKLTMQKFYRINGGSTQLQGVQSDIVIPDKYAYIKVGERDMNNPLPWDKIKPAKYTLWTNNTNFAEAIENSKKRIADNPKFKIIDQNAQWIEKQRDQKSYPLSYIEYKKQIESDEEYSKQLKTQLDYKSNLVFISLPNEEELVKTNEDLKLRRDRWFETLQKDLYIDEAVNVLNDLLK